MRATEKQEQLLLLEQLVQRAGITVPWVINSLLSLKLRWNDLLYSALSGYVTTAIEEIQPYLLQFNAPESQEEMPGELRLGSLANGSGIQCLLPRERLSQHIFIAGMSGSGKTTLALTLAEQAHLNGICVKIVDPKADDYIKLAHKYPDFHVLNWRDLRFNPLTPPPNVPQDIWFQTFVGHMSQAFNFWQGGEALLLRLLTKLQQSDNRLALPELRSALYNRKGFGPKDAAVISTVSSRVQMLLDLFGVVITTESTMLEQLAQKNLILSTTGLLGEADSWLSEFLFLWEYFFRVFNPDKCHPLLFNFDECQHRLFSSEKERKLQKLGASLISQLVDQARAMNLGICSLSQEPSTVIKALLNNSFCKIAFHLGSGSEIKTMKEAMGLTNEQADALHYLETGEAIVRTAGGFLDAFPVKCDNFNAARELSGRDFQEHQASLRTKLYEESQIQSERQTGSGSQEKRSKPESQQGRRAAKQEHVLKSCSEQDSESHRPLDKLKPVLQVWLNLPTPFLTQGQIFEHAGITSGSTQSQLKKLALRYELIREHKLQMKRTKASVWEPLEKAYQVVGLEKPALKSKGGFLHQFIAHHVKTWAQKQGYKAEIEAMLADGKAVDLLLDDGNERVVVEIAVSLPLEKELSNIRKDFSSNPAPSGLIMVVTDSKANKHLEQLIASDETTAPYRNKIQIKLAGKFLAES